MSGWVTSGPFGVMLIIVGFHSHHPELNTCILDMDCLLIWILVICVDCKKGSACDHRFYSEMGDETQQKQMYLEMDCETRKKNGCILKQHTGLNKTKDV